MWKACFHACAASERVTGITDQMRAGEFGKPAFTRVQPVRRRAGNIPASDHGTPTFTVSRAIPSQTIGAKTPPAVGGGAKVLQPQYSCRARRGVSCGPSAAANGGKTKVPTNDLPAEFCMGIVYKIVRA